MLKKINSNFSLSFMLLAAICVFFYACREDETITPQETKIEQTLFQKYQNDHTQHIPASDLGNGTYEAIGKAGTIININNALVNSNGDRVRGNIDIELIEIYTVAEMIQHRKQTLSNDNGKLGILESGGEIFIKIYQNGEELSVDGNGEMNLLLPTENTGGAKENMELYYGQEIGEQVIWIPTGNEVRVVNPASRNGSFYVALIQNTLGWVNVDRLNELTGQNTDCIDVIVNCEDICPGAHVTASMHVKNLNSAFEVPTVGGNAFQLCGPFPIGGVQATFIIVLECPDGRVFVSMKTVSVNAPMHTEMLNCQDFSEMTLEQFDMALVALMQ